MLGVQEVFFYEDEAIAAIIRGPTMSFTSSYRWFTCIICSSRVKGYALDRHMRNSHHEIELGR